jgi:hypothetical protein
MSGINFKMGVTRGLVLAVLFNMDSMSQEIYYHDLETHYCFLIYWDQTPYIYIHRTLITTLWQDHHSIKLWWACEQCSALYCTETPRRNSTLKKTAAEPNLPHRKVHYSMVLLDSRWMRTLHHEQRYDYVRRTSVHVRR